ncbi:P-loop containing nucleoside triphosphate hydrolase protein, partial [Dendrothele bispora CBS 962.96]
ICTGKYQIIVISPEMMLSQKFIKNVLKNEELAHRILSIIIDEAHVISHWGTGFRKKYGELGILRALLPKGIPFVVLSATLPPRVRQDVLTKLHFSRDESDYININLGNDRPNVSLVVRAMQHPMNTYQDLDFVIPQKVQKTNEIKKTFIYADNISTGVEIAAHLESLLPDTLQYTGLIRPYNAAYSQKYRKAAMKQFREGQIRVLVCTDAAGMGCNIPDIDVIVQWKLPDTMSNFVQRAGRAARDRNRQGLAVLLVEKSAYGLDCENLVSDISTGTQKAKKKADEVTDYVKSTLKNYADLHGVKRGAYGGTLDGTDKNHLPHYTPTIKRNSRDEGLLAFVQTGTCRRRIIAAIYSNRDLDPKVDCCDVCVPTLLNCTRPGYYKAPPRKAAVVKGVPYKPTKQSLHEWRVSVYQRDFKYAQWGYRGILSDETLEMLSAVGPIESKSGLAVLLEGKWSWWEQYGEDMWAKISTLNMPP